MLRIHSKYSQVQRKPGKEAKETVQARLPGVWDTDAFLYPKDYFRGRATSVRTALSMRSGSTSEPGGTAFPVSATCTR